MSNVVFSLATSHATALVGLLVDFTYTVITLSTLGITVCVKFLNLVLRLVLLVLNLLLIRETNNFVVTS
jgi:hypothetical protein